MLKPLYFLYLQPKPLNNGNLNIKYEVGNYIESYIVDFVIKGELPLLSLEPLQYMTSLLPHLLLLLC